MGFLSDARVKNQNTRNTFYASICLYNKAMKLES